MRVALIVLLALQLVLGSWIQVAHAATHGAAQAVTHGAAQAVTADHATSHADCDGSGKDTTPGKHPNGDTHDCCRTNACQCSCVPTPATPDLLVFNDLPTSSVLPSLSRALVVAPRIDEFLRPPIA